MRNTFTFWEDYEQYSQSLSPVTQPGGRGQPGAGESAQYPTVVQGDTLWGIAQSLGTTVAALLALNPQIKNPNLISPGQQIRVR